MSHACPSCGGLQQVQLDSVGCGELLAAYRHVSLNTDISALVPAAHDPLKMLECAGCGLRWFWPLVTGDEAFYESLQRHDWYYQSFKPEYPYAASLIPAGAAVLEVGCGRGVFASYLQSEVHYRGLEFNEEAARKAQSQGLEVMIRPIQEEAKSSQGRYDVACHFQVLEHVSDPHGFMRACADVVRPSGLVIVTVPSEDSFLSVAASAWLNMPPHHVTRWSDAALASLFSRVGLEVQDVWHEPVADFHRDWYQSVMAGYAVGRLLGRRPSLVGHGLAHRIAGRLARFPGLRNWFAARGEAAFPYPRRGHSVCISGYKRNA